MKLYDIYDNGEYLRTCGADEAAEFLGCSRLHVGNAAKLGYHIGGRYTVEDTEDCTLTAKDRKLLIEFEVVCELINAKHRKRNEKR